MDGAIYHNNPIQIADKERKILWGATQAKYPDVLVSIGTTYGPDQSNSDLSSAPPQLGVLSHGKSLLKIAIDHIASALDSEKAWKTYMEILQPPRDDRARFVRLNPQLKDAPPSLEDVECVQSIKNVVRKQMTGSERIAQLALQLVASCFYFEKSGAVELQPDDSYECQGRASSLYAR